MMRCILFVCVDCELLVLADGLGFMMIHVRLSMRGPQSHDILLFQLHRNLNPY